MATGPKRWHRSDSDAKTINQLWDRIEAWLAVHAPLVAASLNPPTSSRELARTEQFLDRKLPPDFRATYLRHDGQSLDVADLFPGWQWLSLEEIRCKWASWISVLGQGYFVGKPSDTDGLIIKNDWWNPAWIPFTGEESDHLCIDLEPGPKGNVGQVIQLWHDWDGRPLVAPSFTDMLGQFAKDLEDGNLVVGKDGGLFHREDL